MNFIYFLDQYIHNLLLTHIPFIQWTAFIFSTIFDPFILGIFGLGILLILHRRGQKLPALLFFYSTTVASIFGLLIKYVFNRPRPELIVPLEVSPAFPSSHALVVTTATLALCFVLDKKYTEKHKKLIVLSSIIIILLVSISRLVLGVHWFSDVIGGIVIGMIWFFVTKELIYRKRH